MIDLYLQDMTVNTFDDCFLINLPLSGILFVNLLS